LAPTPAKRKVKSAKRRSLAARENLTPEAKKQKKEAQEELEKMVSREIAHQVL
jgi:hypothetical protein